MHPVLLEVPWPALGVPLWPLFALLALLGAVIAGVAFARRSRFTTALGVGLVCASVLSLFTSHGVLFTPGPFQIRAWGAFLAGALVLGGAVTLRRGVRAGLERDAVVHACIAAAIGGILGGRIGWALVHPEATASLSGVLAFYSGGLSAFGALAGALVAAHLLARRARLSLPPLLDAAAPSIGLGVFLIKLGCYFEGCDFGVPLARDAPHFLVSLGTFPQGSPAWTLQVLARGLSPSASASLPVHPLELYESIAGLALVGVAFLVERRGARPGAIFAAAALAFLLLRVSLDSLRDDPREMWVSRTLLFVVVLASCAFLTLRRLRSARK
jgi:phosphatidylglycerol:prolipoprotein diacylglycerol transferase